MLTCDTSLHDDTTISDFSITHGQQEWKVHRFVLALHSPVLAKASCSDFKVRSSRGATFAIRYVDIVSKEGTERKIDLPDEHPACLAALVYYLYTLVYDVSFNSVSDDLVALSFHVKMCILADKYDMSPLKAMAVRQFEAQAKLDWASEQFAQAAAEAYDASGATRSIRDVVIKVAMDNKALSLSYQAPSPLSKVMMACADFATDYARVLETGPTVSKREGELRLRCPNDKCGVEFITSLDNFINDSCHCFGCDVGYPPGT